MPSIKNVAKIRSRLLGWYDQNARSLPWRATPGQLADPYRVWLSEIMLQQTTVPHAIPYFLTFTRRWPTVADLAAAVDDDVMAAWAGLGYYARARNLLACARVVTKRHDGVFPDTEAGLRTLPGIGPYTAAAIAAIAFDRAANVVDGNVERVMARMFAVETALPAAKPLLAELGSSLVRETRPGDWAQALMDLGATVCRPAGPDCDRCPLTPDCGAARTGRPASYPRRVAKAAIPHRHGVAYRLTFAGEVALVRRPPNGLLGGMLGLPTTSWRTAPWSLAEAHKAAPGTIPPDRWRPAGAVEHVFTHFSLTLAIYDAPADAADAGFVWRPLAEARATTPSLFRKALSDKLG